MTTTLATPAQVNYLRGLAIRSPISKSQRLRLLRVASNKPTRDEFGKAMALLRTLQQKPSRKAKAATIRSLPPRPDSLQEGDFAGVPVIRTPVDQLRTDRLHQITRILVQRDKTATRKLMPKRHHATTNADATIEPSDAQIAQQQAIRNGWRRFLQYVDRTTTQASIAA